MHQIGEVEDIDKANEAKLEGLGISTTDDLLARAAAPAGRSELAGAVGVDVKEILVWANCADLMRVDGIGMQFADLLEAAGVDTIPELAQRNAANLHAKLAAVNGEGKLTGRSPSTAEVETWIAQAKGLPRILVYGGGGGGAADAPDGSAAPAAPAAAATATPAVPAAAPASAPAAAVAAADDSVSSAAESAKASAASTTAHGMKSRSDGLAQGRSWVQMLVDRFRGK